MAALKWFGKTWKSWAEFAAELKKRGIDPYQWAVSHPQAAVQIGAPYGITTVSQGGQGQIYTTTPGAFGGQTGGGGAPVYAGPTGSQPVLTTGGRPVRGPRPGGGGGGGGASGPPNGGRGGIPVYEYPDGTHDYQFPDGSVWHLTPSGWEPSGGSGGGGGDAGFGPGLSGEQTPPSYPWAGADFSQMLGIAGIPGDLIAQITDIFQRVPDPGQAAALALGIVRGSAWYQQTFPGINQGIQRGLFQNEQGYREYRNALEAVYRRWGAPMTLDAFMRAVTTGEDPGVIDRRFEGQNWAQVNRPDVQFLTGAFATGQEMGRQNTIATEQEVQALGEQQAGLPSQVGMRLQRALALAQQRFQRMFEGQAANPQLALTAWGSLFAPGMGQAQRPDIAA